MSRTGYNILIVAGIGAALLILVLTAFQPAHVARSTDGQGSYELLAGAAALVAIGIFGLRREAHKTLRRHRD